MDKMFQGAIWLSQEGKIAHRGIEEMEKTAEGLWHVPNTPYHFEAPGLYKRPLSERANRDYAQQHPEFDHPEVIFFCISKSLEEVKGFIRGAIIGSSAIRTLTFTRLYPQFLGE